MATKTKKVSKVSKVTSATEELPKEVQEIADRVKTYVEQILPRYTQVEWNEREKRLAKHQADEVSRLKESARSDKRAAVEAETKRMRDALRRVANYEPIQHTRDTLRYIAPSLGDPL